MEKQILSQPRLLLKIIVSLFIASCSNQPEPKSKPDIVKEDFTVVVGDTVSVTPKDTNSAGPINLSNYNKYADLAEFRLHGSILDEAATELLIKTGKLGNLPTNAMVPVIVGLNNKLIDAEIFNRGEIGEHEMKIYYTDIKTFQKTTNHPAANVKYTKYMIGDKGKVVWIFDPYQTSYKTQKQVYTSIKDLYQKSSKPLRTSANYLLTSGDIIVYPEFIRSDLDNKLELTFNAMIDRSIEMLTDLGYDSPAALSALNKINEENERRFNSGEIPNSIYGHVAGIPFEYQKWNIQDLFNSTLTAEAQGYNSSSPREEVETRILKEGWWGRRKHMFRLVPREESKPGKYWDPMGFWVFHCKDTNSRYSLFAVKYFTPKLAADGTHAPYKRLYCSLLIWQAYMDLAETDLDGDGGCYVFPNDLLLKPEKYWIIQTYDE